MGGVGLELVAFERVMTRLFHAEIDDGDHVVNLKKLLRMVLAIVRPLCVSEWFPL